MYRYRYRNYRQKPKKISLYEGWDFEKGAIYTIDDDEGKVLNTTLFDDFQFRLGLDLSREMNSDVAKQMNFTGLIKYLATEVIPPDERRSLTVELFDKIALPVTTIAFVLIGVPLAITPPRVRYNRGFLFSILIIFVYYLIRALSIGFGEEGALHPFLAAWMPNIVLTIWGIMIYYKKVYTID